MDELTHLQMTTPDGRAERLMALKRLFPDLFTLEGQLNPDELTKLADPAQIAETERYEFRWFGKTKAKREAYTPTDTTLIYDPDRSLNPSETQNVIIEGENLDVLKLLTCAYREQVKCIYIDPPYNTGNDFVYDDDFAERYHDYLRNTGQRENGIKLDTNSDSDGRFHSKWLDMMLPRLLVARQLLREDGVIFVSIDDHEVHHLRKVMDEVFGEECFIASFIWKSRQMKDNRTTTGASIDHEYVICYAREPETRPIAGAERKQDQYSNPDDDPRGAWASGNMVGLLPQHLRPALHYDLVDPATKLKYSKPDLGWRYDRDTMKWLIEDKRILWPKSSDGRPRRKVFLSELSFSTTGFSSLVGENIYTRDGSKQIDDFFKFRAFDFPKPSSLIAELIAQTTGNSDLILDFFSGSGTTAQAVMELNETDGGKRKYILVQIDEATDPKSEAHRAGYKKISDITIERAKRAAAKLHAARVTAQPKLEEAVAPKPTHGFKVFRLASSQFPRVEWAPDTTKNDDDNLAGLREYIAAKENSMTLRLVFDDAMRELLLKKEGMSLHAHWHEHDTFDNNTVYVAEDPVNDKRVLICLDDLITLDTVEYFKKHRKEKFICLERALDTSAKWNLNHLLGDQFKAF